MNKKTAASMHTKQRLKNAFIELYAKNGISGVTVNAVAKKSGCNRCTFYNHYSTLQDLLDEIENEIIDRVTQNFLNITVDNVLAINTIFSRMMATFEQYGETIYILLGSNGDAAFRQRVKETAKANLRRIMHNEIEPEKLEYLFSYAISAILGLIEHWHSTGKKYTTEEFLQLAQSLIANGATNFISKTDTI